MPDEVKIPSALAIAMMTGRPELAKQGSYTETELQGVAEHLAQSALIERQNLEKMTQAVEMAIQNMEGALAALERVGEGMRLALSGAPSEAIEAAVRNPNKRD